ncbi:MAG: EfeM/EfeO family lipoprotein [Cyanophyceae cyanobacterium]
MFFNRRQLLVSGLVGTGALIGSSLAGQKKSLAQDSDPYAEQVSQGLAYFQEQAELQLPLVKDLLAAIQSGDLANAQAAYILSRPPYEQIEVLAASFPEIDEAIDARPYGYEEGELSPDFISIHRIEAQIFRDQDLESSIPYAERLVESVQSLIQQLQERERFNSKMHFEGLIALSTEVGAKKISSEEETWSDQSILIFRENWQGILSQYQPFESLVQEKDNAAAQAVMEAYGATKESIAAFVQPNVAAATPYSSVGIRERGEITRATYQLRDALLTVMDVLEIG